MKENEDPSPDKAKKWKALIWLGGFGLLAFAFAAGLGFFAKKIPWSWEKRLSQTVGEPPYTECEGPAESRKAFKKLTARIFPLLENDDQIPVRFHVVSTPEVNAFANLGGDIYVFSGLLREAKTPEELTAVLAHELGHLRERHLMQRVVGRVAPGYVLSQFGLGSSGKLLVDLMNLKFSRFQEKEADEQALARLQKAQVSVKGYVDFFKRLAEESSVPELLSDHPDSGDRAEMGQNAVQGDTTPVLTTVEWQALRRICVDTAE